MNIGRSTIIAIVVLILAVAIPVTIRLAQQQTQLKSKAAASLRGEVKFRGPNVSGEGCINPTGDCTATKRDIELEITNPFSQAP